ncbi:hydrogenase expression protein HypA [Streptomyces sp. ACT015]|uniref:hydrogenase expression protein HypA n=1 Tax=Streptomyces sp. ACT015 TaxID=3134807 RepID=UPI003D179F09
MAVRRAVTMRGAAEDPGAALTPGGKQNGRAQEPSAGDPVAGGVPGEASQGDESAATSVGAAEGVRKKGAGSTGDSAATGAVAGTGVPEPEAEAESESESGAGTAPVAAASAAPAAAAPAAPAAVGTVGASADTVVAAVAAGGGGAGARAQAGDEPPGGRPKKPMLAAAAIVGAILISVPILVAGRDDREPPRERTENVAGTVMDDHAQLAIPPGAYTSESPSPSPTPSEKKETKAPEKQAPAAVVHKESASPSPSEPKSRPTATVTARAPLNTAATAVNRLARNDPDGRHICYRAFVGGSGWQTPVCDGTMAGTTGQGKRITALNIAVWNAGGSSANALLHNPDSTDGNAKWQPNWTAVMADGKNVYIGSSKPGAPFMTGFAMNVGSGSVCHSAKMHNGGWGPQYCKNARPEYLFGGTTDNTNWFEAVKLTV